MSEVKERLNLDTALAAWPAPERPANEWEAQAERIEARIASVAVDAAARQDVAGGPSDILGAPTPATPEEVQDSAAPSGGGARSLSRPGIAPAGVENKMQPTERERDRKNLQDLARLASAPSLTPLAPKVAPVSSAPTPHSAPLARPVEAKQGDSGIVDLKMMAKADPKAEERAKTTPLATAELFDDDGRPSQAPAPRSAPVAVQAVAAPKAARVQNEKKGGPWFAVGGATTIVAIAAAAVLMLRSSQQAPVREPVAVSPPATAAVSPTVESNSETKPEATKPEAVAEAKNPAPPSASAPAADIDIGKLPLAESTKPMQKVYGGPQKAGKPSAEKAIDPKLIANNLPPTPNQNGTLNDALKQASGNKDDSTAQSTPAATGPAFAAGSVPQKPSQGAVTGALGAVMPTVRACLQPDDPISRASVVFDSTGTVTGISVTGAAAGKPAEACIKSALSKAKVQPFAQPTYTANVTIRPN